MGPSPCDVSRPWSTWCSPVATEILCGGGAPGHMDRPSRLACVREALPVIGVTVLTRDVCHDDVRISWRGVFDDEVDHSGARCRCRVCGCHACAKRGATPD